MDGHEVDIFKASKAKNIEYAYPPIIGTNNSLNLHKFGNFGSIQSNSQRYKTSKLFGKVFGRPR